jgi:ATP-dependent DNA helicase DinG
MTELVQLGLTNPVVMPKNLNTNWSPNIRDHFPFGEIRDQQELGMAAVEKAYALGLKYIILEGPTGSGKSGIGIAAASWAKTQPAPANFESGAYVLSPQKSLTDQYMKDFESMGLVTLKGRANYTCSDYHIDGNPVDCETGALMSKEGEGEGCSFCPYKEAKLRFTQFPLGVTNFAYYLNETQFAGQLVPRKMLVLDEGHNIEQQVLSLADIVVNRFRCDEVGIDFLSVPVIKPGQTQKGATWLRETFKVAANALIMKWQSELRDFKEDNDTANVARLGKKLSGLQRFMGKIEMFLISVVESSNDWIVYTDETKGSESFGCLIIKPLTATLFADDILFSKADKVLIMSATIGDFAFFMRNLGIDPENAVCCRLDCDFPIENRPVFLKPVANMSSTKVACPDCSTPEDAGKPNRSGNGCSRCWKSGQVPSIEVAMPKVAKFLGSIMTHKNYIDKKGIVHTGSYKVTQFMTTNLDVENRLRVVTHTSQKGSRDAAILKHIEAEDPTVIFSPSMTEGLDLKDDLSRFSVIVKVPFPYLDPYVKARMARDGEWYAYCVALALVQATGRSNRHKDDKAHHYILDAAIINFLGQWSKLFPKWWLDAVVWPS